MARFSSGWIKIWRKAIDSDLSGNVYLWTIWHWLLIAATWKPSKILWNGKQREIPPGTVVFGLKELSLKWGCSRSVVNKWLHYLHDTGRIVYETSTRGSIVTIQNWEIYQGNDDHDADTREHGDYTAATARLHGETLSEEDKKERKKEYIAPREKIHECVKEWGKTLGRYSIQKDPALDELQIARLMQIHGVEKTKLALLGAGYEQKSERYDPARHCRISRLLKSDIFELCVNLGAQNQPKTREVYEVQT